MIYSGFEHRRRTSWPLCLSGIWPFSLDSLQKVRKNEYLTRWSDVFAITFPTLWSPLLSQSPTSSVLLSLRPTSATRGANHETSAAHSIVRLMRYEFKLCSHPCCKRLRPYFTLLCFPNRVISFPFLQRVKRLLIVSTSNFPTWTGACVRCENYLSETFEVRMIFLLSY